MRQLKVAGEVLLTLASFAGVGFMVWSMHGTLFWAAWQVFVRGGAR